MLKSRKLGGPALMLVATLLITACGGAGPDVPQSPAVTEPAQIESMAEPAPNADSTAERMAVEGDPSAEAAAVEVEEMAPAEEESVAETGVVVEPDPATDERSDAEPEPMLEEIEVAETDDSTATMADEMAGQDEVVTEEMAEANPGPTEKQVQLLQSLEVLGTPVELHNEVWLNSEPLKLADLRGQVTIVEFWTYG